MKRTEHIFLFLLKAGQKNRKRKIQNSFPKKNKTRRLLHTLSISFHSPSTKIGKKRWKNDGFLFVCNLSIVTITTNETLITRFPFLFTWPLPLLLFPACVVRSSRSQRPLIFCLLLSKPQGDSVCAKKEREKFILNQIVMTVKKYVLRIITTRLFKTTVISSCVSIVKASNTRTIYDRFIIHFTTRKILRIPRRERKIPYNIYIQIRRR
jgi:hypothetical protein